MIKNPKFDLRYQYRKVLEASAVIALLCIILTFMLFKKFEVSISMRGMDAPAIEVEDIPITRTIKKVEVPRKPTIPIEDPDIDMADDIELPDLLDIFNPDLAPPPPPPPPDEEVIPFFKVEQKPLLDGGNAAIAAYIVKHDLFPKMAREAGVSGKVMIEFVVDKDGATREVTIKAERPEGLGFGEAGVKVMKAMRFKPGMQRDRPVSVRMQQPISFTME